jgi:hypothetical protein
MIKSYSEYFDNNVPLYVYNEDATPFKVKNVNSIKWELGSDYTKFQKRWTSNSKIRGFSKKAFSIIHAMNNIECDRLIWLDADTIITRNVLLQFLELISPSDVLSTHYGVVHPWPSDTDNTRTAFSCETGFFILNKRHESFNKFREIYTDMYVNDRIENIRRFYDGEVYGETVRILSNDGVKMLDLNPGNVHKTPMPRSILAPYISHSKAGLKDTINYNEIEKLLDEKNKSI